MASPASAAKTVDKITLQNGHDVWYVAYGQSNALDTFVLIHGAPGSHKDFGKLAPLLTARNNTNVVAVDVPGNGRTSAAAAGDDGLSETRIVDAMIETAAIVASQEPQRRIFLVGHSFGGATAMQVAARCKLDALAGLALVNSTGFRPHVMARPFWLVRFLYKLLVWSPFTRFFMSWFVHAFLQNVGGFKLTKNEAIYTYHRIGTMDFAAIQASANVIAGAKLPVFCATALKDRFVEKEIGEEVRAVLKPVITNEIDSNDHNIQESRADELATGLLRWVASIPREKLIPGASA